MEEDILLLFKRIENGDPYAYIEIYNKYHKSVRATAMKWMDDDWMIEEVVRDTFVELWYKRALIMKYQNPPGWLHRVARNMSISADRKASNFKEAIQKYSEEQFKSDVENEALAGQVKSVLLEGISKLPPQQQKIALIMFEDNPPRKIIARSMNLSDSTIKNHITQLREFLKNFFEENYLAIILFIFLKD